MCCIISEMCCADVIICYHFFLTKTNQVGKILIVITAGGVSVILLTYLVAFIRDFIEVINSINFVNNIIDRILYKCIPTFILISKLLVLFSKKFCSPWPKVDAKSRH